MNEETVNEWSALPAEAPADAGQLPGKVVILWDVGNFAGLPILGLCDYVESGDVKDKGKELLFATYIGRDAKTGSKKITNATYHLFEVEAETLKKAKIEYSEYCQQVGHYRTYGQKFNQMREIDYPSKLVKYEPSFSYKNLKIKLVGKIHLDQIVNRNPYIIVNRKGNGEIGDGGTDMSELLSEMVESEKKKASDVTEVDNGKSDDGENVERESATEKAE